MNKPDLALNNLQWLICCKTKPNQTKPIQVCCCIHFQTNFLEKV